MSGVVSTRNGVPPTQASDPPGGVPKVPDPETRPHPAPDEGEPASDVTFPTNQPPLDPPRREAQGDAGVTIHRETTVHVSRNKHK